MNGPRCPDLEAEDLAEELGRLATLSWAWTIVWLRSMDMVPVSLGTPEWEDR